VSVASITKLYYLIIYLWALFFGTRGRRHPDIDEDTRSYQVSTVAAESGVGWRKIPASIRSFAVENERFEPQNDDPRL
jgi:hypothetical protein